MAGFRGVARRTARRTSRRQMAMMQGGSEPEGDVPPEPEVGNESDYLDKLILSFPTTVKVRWKGGGIFSVSLLQFFSVIQ